MLQQIGMIMLCIPIILVALFMIGGLIYVTIESIRNRDFMIMGMSGITLIMLVGIVFILLGG